MNTTHRRWAPAIAFAGLVMAATAACGSDTPVAPANVSDPIQQEMTAPKTQGTEGCMGQQLMSADHWDRTARGCTPARPAQPSSADELRAAQSRMDVYRRIPNPTP